MPGPEAAASKTSKTRKSSSTATGTGDTCETDGGNGTKYADCRVDGLTTAAELQDQPKEPPRRFLLTVTDNLKTPCVLNDAPQVRLKAGNDAPIVRTLGEPDTEPVVVAGGGKAHLLARGGRVGRLDGEADLGDVTDAEGAPLAAGALVEGEFPVGGPAVLRGDGRLDAVRQGRLGELVGAGGDARRDDQVEQPGRLVETGLDPLALARL